MDYIADMILSDFATVGSDNRPGDLNFSTGESIGAYVNTLRSDEVGDHPVAGATTTTTTTLYQNTGSISESLVRPLQWDASQGIEEQSDTDLNNSVIAHIIGKIANTSDYATGQYFLGASAPSGGTWTSKGSFTDTIAAGESATDTYQLWRKIASGNSPTEYRPIKASANATSSSVSEMNNTDIKTLTDRLRNRIISTGVGTYKLQTAAPATGTWLQVSDSITDNLR